MKASNASKVASLYSSLRQIRALSTHFNEHAHLMLSVRVAGQTHEAIINPLFAHDFADIIERKLIADIKKLGAEP